MNDTIKLRPSVQAFAERMEMTLRKHDATKGGQANWRKDSEHALYLRLLDESGELNKALGFGTREDVAREAIDVANFALMIADVCLPLPEDSQ